MGKVRLYLSLDELMKTSKFFILYVIMSIFLVLGNLSESEVQLLSGKITKNISNVCYRNPNSCR